MFRLAFIFSCISFISFIASAQYYPVVIDSIIMSQRKGEKYVHVFNPSDYNKLIEFDQEIIKKKTTHYFEIEIAYNRDGSMDNMELVLVADTSVYYTPSEVASKECKLPLKKNADLSKFDCSGDVFTYNYHYENGISSWTSRDFQQVVENIITKDKGKYLAFTERIRKGDKILMTTNFFFFYDKDKIYILDLIEEKEEENSILEGSSVPAQSTTRYRTNFLYELLLKDGKVSAMNEYNIDEWDIKKLSEEYIKTNIQNETPSRRYQVDFSDKLPKNSMATRKNINKYIKNF